MSAKKFLPLFSLILAVAGTAHAQSIPEIPGLQLRLDAGNAGSMQTVDGEVLQWSDSSGNNDIVFTPLGAAGTNSPVWQDNVINGRPAVLFNSSSLDTTSPDALGMTNNISGITFFAVGWNTGSGAQLYSRISAGGDTSPNTARAMFYRATSDHRLGGRRNDSDGFQSIETPSGTRLFEEWGIDSGFIDYGNARSAFSINGELLVEDNSFLDPGNTSATDSNTFRVGSNAGGSDGMSPGQFWDGYIAEFLIFDRVLSEQEMLEVGRYLGEKYDLAYVPEPSSYALLMALGVGIVAAYRRRAKVRNMA